MFFFAFFELGSLLCGVAVSSKMLIVGRAVASIGASGMMNSALTMIRACVPMEKTAGMGATVLNYQLITDVLRLKAYLGIMVGSKSPFHPHPTETCNTDQL